MVGYFPSSTLSAQRPTMTQGPWAATSRMTSLWAWWSWSVRELPVL